MNKLYSKHPGTSCAAVGCSNRPGTNLLSKIRLFRFPKDLVRRNTWINAVHRENWTPTTGSRICNAHFVTGQPSKDRSHPDWAPSLFAHSASGSRTKSEGKLKRYERFQARSKNVETKIDAGLEDDHLLSPDCSMLPPSPEPPKFKNMSTMTDLTAQDIKAQEEENLRLRERLIDAKTEKCNILSKIKQNNKLCKFFTGLNNYHIFTALMTLIMSFFKPQTKTNLCVEEQLLVVLLKMRLGCLNQDLAVRFNVACSTISNIFAQWNSAMTKALHTYIYWPSNVTRRRNMPKCFWSTKLNNVTCTVDCSEIFIQRPSNLLARAKTYSHYKHHNTAKFLIAISPSGGICFVSKVWGGRVSDKKLIKHSGFLDKISSGDIVLADRGFQIEDLLGVKGAVAVTPSFTKGKNQLSGIDVSKSRQISRVRVHVERVIGRLKSFRILQYTLPLKFIKKSSDEELCTLDKVLINICALCNFQSAIIKK